MSLQFADDSAWALSYYLRRALKNPDTGPAVRLLLEDLIRDADRLGAAVKRVRSAANGEAEARERERLGPVVSLALDDGC